MAGMMSASDYFSKGNAAFVEEDYTKAIELYNQAIQLDDLSSEYYANRGHAFLKQNKYEDCRSDSDVALELGLKNGKIYYRKGIACYNLKEYEEAEKCFLWGKEYDDADSSIPEWLKKCEKELQDKRVKSEISPPAPLVSLKIKHDWYQTEPDLFVIILMKNAKPEDLIIQHTENTLKCCIKRENAEEYTLDLNLAHATIPNQCTSKVLPSKIEIKLKKAEGIQWASLERKETDTSVRHFTPVGSSVLSTQNISHTYPSSSAKKRDWDKIVVDLKKDEENETVEGEGAVNNLFQKIYSEGSDEVKKAMNKSFTESGGTVLSTNWKDIGGKKVDVKPPDGMEWKKWDT